MRALLLRRWWRSVAFAAVWFVLAASGVIAQAADSLLARTVNVNIPAQRLTSALIKLSKQADIQVLMSADVVDGLRTQGVRGEMALGDAITALLKGTELAFRSAGTNTIGVGRADISTGADYAQQSLKARVAKADSQSNSTEGVHNAQPESAEKTASESSGGTIAEMVVTAQKREERILDIPVSIGVVSSRDIERKGIDNMVDLAYAVPGMMVQEHGPGA